MNNVAFIKKSILMLILVLACSTSGIQAQSAADSLQGSWTLESTKQITYVNSEVARTRDFQKSDLMRRDASVQDDLFISIRFIGNSIATVITEKESSTNMSINKKGSFFTNGNHLIVTIFKEPLIEHDMIYSISGDKLSVMLQIPDKTNAAISYQYNMIFKKEY